jgi:hypothetical protein
MRKSLWIGALFAVVSGGPSLAGATKPAFTVPPGWQRAPQQSFTVPAGQLCSFTLQADTVKDQVITKVLATWPGGSPRYQVYTGAYYARFTNVETGASVTRNMSGDALVQWGQDGSANWYYAGPVGVAFFPGGPLPEGMYVIDGVFVIDYAADGSVKMPVHEGTEENICNTLLK